ncbi:hypothetical protein AVEN_76695-1 [Araneus ventricosus]|uniref:Reverse transcriptase domain-containing protein n=1 Tax=Araneus ventricosus TaxID=182803 RepID=A0A4Y2BPV6_ARAVE|nr:hypothetical protein AVEN_76695-1 [Araneus ventricosus]
MVTVKPIYTPEKRENPERFRAVESGSQGNRKVILNTCEGPAIRDQKQGCPQGSCSGPALWNLVANEILQENWPINTSIQAFADDFVLVSHAPTRVQLESQINESIAKFLHLDKQKPTPNFSRKNKLSPYQQAS